LTALLKHSEDERDRNLPQMLWYAIEPMVAQNPARALELARHSRVSLPAVLIARRIGEMRSPEMLEIVLEAAAQAPSMESMVGLMEAVLESLKGRSRVPLPNAWNQVYDACGKWIAERGQASGPLQDVRAALGALCGDVRSLRELGVLSRDAGLPVERRQRALRALTAAGDESLIETLDPLLDDVSLRLETLRSATGLNAAEFATGSKGAVFFGKVLDRFATFNADEKGAAVQALAGRVEGARLLLNAVSEGKVRRMDVPVFAARQIAGLKDSGLAELLEKVWGVVRSADQDIHAKNAEAEHARLKGILTNALLNQAELPAGRVLFKSVCGQCHQLFGEGGRIGPDLTGSNRANLDYVLENVTNPNAVIGKDYELHVWTLKDGKVINGMIRQESDAAFTVQTFAGEEQVSKSEVQSVQKPGVSMMPAGLFSGLSKEQMRDLVGYLRSPRQVALPGEREMHPHVVNGVLEAESLKILSRGLPVGAQVMRNFQQGIWSRDQQLFWRGGKVGDVLELAIPVATKGRYQLKAALTRAPDYGIVRFLVNGMPVGGSVDLFGSKVTNTEEVPIGEIDLPEGQSVLGVEILGANTSARPSRMFGLDYLRLEPIP
jgi:putative heme-binding domain-containing protein